MPNFFVGSKSLDKPFWGSLSIASIWCGNVLVWPLTTEALCFTANEATNITFTQNGSLSSTPTLKYRLNNGAWQDYTLGTAISLSTNDKCYFKGDNSNFSSSGGYINFTSTGKVSASGKVMSLVDSTCKSTSLPSDYCFYKLFSGCSKLLSAPTLSATSLSTSGYQEMFSGCTSLSTAPTLSATTMPDSCYLGMFSGCTSLTAPPSTIGSSCGQKCCYQMFSGCTSLNSTPTLPATTVGVDSYREMFSGCTSLTTPPSLPATTLASACYMSMFKGSGLTTAPTLSSTSLDTSCYQSMFMNCTSLTSAIELPATTLASSCYQEMFSGCTSLSTVFDFPSSTATTAVASDSCYKGMFMNCKTLVSPPNFQFTTYATSCCESMFEGCTSFVSIDYTFSGVELNNKTAVNSCFKRMFFGCTSLVRAASFDNAQGKAGWTTATACCESMYEGCTSLTQPPKIFITGSDHDLTAECYKRMFYGCSSLTVEFDDSTWGGNWKIPNYYVSVSGIGFNKDLNTSTDFLGNCPGDRTFRKYGSSTYTQINDITPLRGWGSLHSYIMNFECTSGTPV